jgi:protein transport protein SEC13
MSKAAIQPPESTPVETGHEDMIVNFRSCNRGGTIPLIALLFRSQHDAQLDYYGKRLATCSSDRTIKVFDVVDGEAQRQSGGQTLKGCVFDSSVL